MKVRPFSTFHVPLSFFIFPLNFYICLSFGLPISFRCVGARFGAGLTHPNPSPQETQIKAAVDRSQSDGSDVSLLIRPPLPSYRPIILHSLERKDQSAYDNPLDLHNFLNLTIYPNGNFQNGIWAKVPKDKICHSKKSFIAHFSKYFFHCRGRCRVFLNNGW